MGRAAARPFLFLLGLFIRAVVLAITRQFKDPIPLSFIEWKPSITPSNRAKRAPASPRGRAGFVHPVLPPKLPPFRQETASSVVIAAGYRVTIACLIENFR